MPVSPEQTALDRTATRRGIDPRTKLLILIVTNVALVAYGDAGGFSWSRAGFALLSAFLLLSSRLYGVLALSAALYAAAAVVDAAWLPSASGPTSFLLAAVSGVVLRLLPGFVIAFWIVRTTEISEFVAAMQSARAPKSLTVPIAVMLRFFPTIAQEHAQIRAALRLRTSSLRRRGNPLRALQWHSVPLITSAVTIGEDLTAAALSRGLEAPGARTSLQHVRLGVRDLILAVIVVGLAIWHLGGMWA